MKKKSFGDKLRELRGDLSQKALAEKSGLSQNAISQWETGERQPGWAAFLHLVIALGVNCMAFTECEDFDDDKPKVKRKSKK